MGYFLGGRLGRVMAVIPLLWRGGENFKEIFDGVV